MPIVRVWLHGRFKQTSMYNVYV